MVYGVTNKGFVRKTNEKIISDLKENWKLLFGQDSDLSEDSPNSILIGLFSSASDELWQTAENTYNSLNKKFATDVNLENITSLVGIERKEPSPSTANVSFRGDNSSPIPLGTQVGQSSTNLIFETIEDNRFISQTNCNWIKITVNTLNNSETYRIYVNSSSYSYTSSSSANLDEIVDGLKSVIELSNLGLTIVNEGSGTMVIEAVDKNDSYDINLDPKMSVDKVQSQIEVEATESGKNIIDSGTIDSIITSLIGLDSVRNYYEGELGTDLETEQELRNRSDRDIAVSGFNYADAIRAKLIDGVDGISYCKVYENTTMVTNINGIEPKSYEVVVEGSSDLNIAKKLFSLKTAGLNSSGDITVEVKDSQNVPQKLKFSRPTNLYIWVKVVIDSYNEEETFPIGGEKAIRDSILEFGNGFNIGEIIVTQKLYNPLYSVVGIANATITIASTLTTEDTPSYNINNINCSIKERPVFDLSRIEVLL